MPQFQVTETLSPSQLEALRQALLQRLQGPKKELPIVKYEIQLEDSFKSALSELNETIDRLKYQANGSDFFAKNHESAKKNLNDTMMKIEMEWQRLDKVIATTLSNRVSTFQVAVDRAKNELHALDSTLENSSFDRKIKQFQDEISQTKGSVSELALIVDELNQGSLKLLREQLQMLTSSEDSGSGIVSRLFKSSSFHLTFLALTLGLSAFTAWKINSNVNTAAVASSTALIEKGAAAPNPSIPTVGATKDDVMPGSVTTTLSANTVTPTSAFCSPEHTENVAFCNVAKRYKSKMCDAIGPENPNDKRNCHAGVAQLLKAQ